MNTSAMASGLRQMLLILVPFLIQFNNAYPYCCIFSLDTAQPGARCWRRSG
jgi:hypothetical protein